MADPSEYDDTDMTQEEFDEALARSTSVYVQPFRSSSHALRLAWWVDDQLHKRRRKFGRFHRALCDFVDVRLR